MASLAILCGCGLQDSLLPIRFEGVRVAHRQPLPSRILRQTLEPVCEQLPAVTQGPLLAAVIVPVVYAKLRDGA